MWTVGGVMVVRCYEVDGRAGWCAIPPFNVKEQEKPARYNTGMNNPSWNSEPP